MVATHSEGQKLCLYRLNIKWDPAQWDPSQMKHANSGISYPTPSLQFVHSKVETPSTIFNTPGMENINDISQPSNSLFCLTHLKIINNSTAMGGSPGVPYILGVFSTPVHALDEPPQQNGPSSVIVRWQLDTSAQDFHASFDDVVSKKPKVQIKVNPS